MVKEFSFAPSKKSAGGDTALSTSLPPWRVLIVDDEEEIHTITRLALRNFRYKDRELEMLSAYSGAQAVEMIAKTPDIAVILLDVVMETSDAGLKAVRQIREDIGNRCVRIILRTGQPGQAPEDSIIVDYDINDYKAKSDLTAQKLFTSIVVALRGYSDIMKLEKNRQGLQDIISAADSLMKLRSMRQFASGVLLQLSSFVGCGPSGVMFFYQPSNSKSINILAATGEFTNSKLEAGENTSITDMNLTPQSVELVQHAFSHKETSTGEDHTVVYFGEAGEISIAALLKGATRVEGHDRNLVELFARKMADGFANLALYEKIQRHNEDLEAEVAKRTCQLEEANIELKELATTDSLTGISNRRHFLQGAADAIEEARRTSTPLTIALCDVDHFKSINDTYGHHAGDEALRMLTDTLGQGLRSTDLFGRVGGEEFAILFTDCDPDEARTFSDRLRLALEANKVTCDKGQFNITMSVGLAETTNGDATVQGLLSKADEALYLAKQSGRNRVVYQTGQPARYCDGASIESIAAVPAT